VRQQQPFPHFKVVVLNDEREHVSSTSWNACENPSGMGSGFGPWELGHQIDQSGSAVVLVGSAKTGPALHPAIGGEGLTMVPTGAGLEASQLAVGLCGATGWPGVITTAPTLKRLIPLLENPCDRTRHRDGDPGGDLSGRRTQPPPAAEGIDADHRCYKCWPRRASSPREVFVVNQLDKETCSWNFDGWPH